MSKDMTLEQLRDHLAMQSTRSTMRKIGRIVLRHAADAESRAKDINSDVLMPRTGHLNQSIRATPKMDGSQITVELAAGGGREDVKYAKVHEQQGYPGTYFIIKPVKAAYLTFPVSADAFTPVGVARGGGEGSAWRSVKKVKIPSRPFLRPAFEEMEDSLIPIVKALVKDEVLTRG